MVAIKNRSQADEWKVVDTLRGATLEMNFDSQNGESTDSNGVTAFGTNSFSLGTGAAGYNDNTENFVSYGFLVDATAGFDQVEYSGTGVAKNENHSLGQKPDFIAVKNETTAINSWAVYVDGGQVADPETDEGALDNNAVFNDNVDRWNDTAPTATVFTVGTHDGVNGSGNTYIGYLWADDNADTVYVVGSYTGNGSADGPFAYTRGRPQWVVTKRWNVGVGGWNAFDTKRSTYNVSNLSMSLEDVSIESSGSSNQIDILSNGFKIRGTGSATNTSGSKYIFIAALESHQKYARAR